MTNQEIKDRIDRRNNKGKYKGKYSEDNNVFHNDDDIFIESDLDDLNDRDLIQLQEWRDIVHQWDLESSRGCKGMCLLIMLYYT